MQSCDKVDDYHCIKLPLKKILHETPKTKTITLMAIDKEGHKEKHNIVIGNLSNQLIIQRINDAVIRTNQIMIKTYLLLRYWVLLKYQRDDSIPIITKDLIFTAIKSICTPKGEFGQIRKTETKLLISEFHQINPFELEDDSYLSGVFNYQTTTILTNIENNVKAHFPDYLRKYINIMMEHTYPERLVDKESKKQFYAEIKKVKNDLLFNRDPQRWTCNSNYHSWMRDQRYKILPEIDEEYSYYYDVCVAPQKYLKYMIYMNLKIGEMDGSMFQFFPLQTDIVPKHIPIDTKSLIEILVSEGNSTMVANIESCQEDIWNTYFNITQQSDTYPFGFTIITDGYCASIRLVHHLIMDKKRAKQKRAAEARAQKRALKNLPEVEVLDEEPPKQKCVKVKKPKSPPEFLYIDEVDKSQLMGEHFFFDPGKDRLLSGIGDGESEEYFSYSNKQRLGDTKRLKYQRIIENYRTKQGIIPIEQELSGYNSKTCDPTLFRIYMIRKIETNRKIANLYADPKYRQYKWYGYLNRMRCDDTLINDLKTRLTNGRLTNGRLTNGRLTNGRQSSDPIIKVKNKKHRQKTRKKRLLHNKVHKKCVYDRKQKSHQKKERKIIQNIRCLRTELGLMNSTKPRLGPKQSESFKESVRIINCLHQSISQMDLQIDLLDNEIGLIRQRIWNLTKSICQLKQSFKPLKPLKPADESPQTSQDSPTHQIVNHRPIIIMGDWSQGKQLRGIISTPNKRLTRLLAKIFPLYLIDEFRTSCLHYQTEGKCSNLEVPDATGKLRKIHAVLTYQTETNGLACINRDNNGCRNIRKLFNCYIETGTRPYRYRRDVDI